MLQILHLSNNFTQNLYIEKELYQFDMAPLNYSASALILLYGAVST